MLDSIIVQGWPLQLFYRLHVLNYISHISVNIPAAYVIRRDQINSAEPLEGVQMNMSGNKD